MNMKPLQHIAGASLLIGLLSIGLTGCGQSDQGKPAASNSSPPATMPAPTNPQPPGGANPPPSSSE